MILLHFQTKIVLCMSMRTHGHQTMVTETSKTTFRLQHSFILVSNPIHQYNIFLFTSFSQAG